jgi:hypothetical protein
MGWVELKMGMGIEIVTQLVHADWRVPASPFEFVERFATWGMEDAKKLDPSALRKAMGWTSGRDGLFRTYVLPHFRDP